MGDGRRFPPGLRDVPFSGLWRMRGLLPLVQGLAGRYGDVSHFRVGGRHFYLLNHPDLVKQVLVTDAGRFIKGPAIRNAKVTLGEGLLSSDGELHKRQRRLITPVFHPSRVATYVGEMARYGEELAGRWREGEVFDVHEQMTGLTLRVVTQVLFGGEIGEDVGRIGEAMGVLVKMFDRARNPLAPVLNRLPLPSNFRFVRALGEVESILQGFIERKREEMGRGRDEAGEDAGGTPAARGGGGALSGDKARGAEPSPRPSPGVPGEGEEVGGAHPAREGGRRGQGRHPDLLTLLLRAQDVEGGTGGMSDKQLRDEAVTLFTAGHETTANALVWTWYLLAQHAEVEREMHAEVDRVLGRDRVAVAGDLEGLTYTRMVLAESMRLYPPAWVVAREVVGEYEAGGYRVPGGSVLLMSQFLLHRDKRFWEEPERFDPLRFTEEQKAGRPRYAYFPFGSGPRACIGEGFAWAEATVLLATLARRWRLELVGGQGGVKLHPTITLRPRGALMMRVIARG